MTNHEGVGEFLEQREEVDEFLAHFGVKGMKWGVVRKDGGGGLKGAAKNHALRITDNAIKLHQNARDGKGIAGLAAKLDKVTWGGNGRFEKYHAAKIEQLENSRKQIEDGKKIVRTIVRGAQYTRTKK